MDNPDKTSAGAWATQFLLPRQHRSLPFVSLHSNASCLGSRDAFADNPSPDNRNVAVFTLLHFRQGTVPSGTGRAPRVKDI